MNDDFQKKAVQFQILETNMKALQAKSDEISQRIEEGMSTRHAIEELKDAKPAGALIPLGSGNFATER
jgi:prefoldin subunit 5